MSEKEVVRAVQGSQFEVFIHDHELIFIDFWATWCAPCMQFAKIYEKVAIKHPDIVFAKINIETEQELAESFHIRSIPHLMVLKQGIIIYSEAGSMPESTLTELIQQARDADVK